MVLHFRGLDLQGQDQVHYINKDFYGIFGNGRCALRRCVCSALNLETVVRGFKYNVPVVGHQRQAFNRTNKFRVITPKPREDLGSSQIIRPRQWGIISMSPLHPCTSSTQAPTRPRGLSKSVQQMMLLVLLAEILLFYPWTCGSKAKRGKRA